MDFLAKQFNAENRKGPFWTGGTDKGSEGQWFWITSLKTMGDFVGGKKN